MVRSRDPLFHVVVMLGAAAAVVACGETARPHGGNAGSAGEGTGTGGGGGGGAGAGVGGEGPQLVTPGAAGQDANVTTAGTRNDPCSGGGQTGAVPEGDGSAGEAAGLADCPPPQLRCASYSPAPTDCSCIRGAPLSVCDCLNRNSEGWTCAVFDPPMGCECVGYITGPK